MNSGKYMRQLLRLGAACLSVFIPLRSIDAGALSPDYVLLDQITAVLYSNESGKAPTIFTAREKNIPGIDGMQTPLDEKIFQESLYREAEAHHAVPSEDLVKKSIKARREESGLSPEEFEKVIEQTGRTYQQVVEELQKQMAIQQWVQMRIPPTIPTEQEIQGYYEQNPIVEPRRYRFQSAKFPLANYKNAQELSDRLTSPQFFHGVAWSDPFWVNDDETIPSLRSIFSEMKNNEWRIIPAAQSFEVFYLLERVEEQVVPLEQRYQQIAQELYQKKRARLLEDYRKSIREKQAVLYPAPLSPTHPN